MADITFVIAPIGGGKSLMAVGELCKELRKSERFIVTNLPLVLTAEECDKDHECLCDWAAREIERPVDIRKRVRRLTPDEVKHFWCYLPGVDLPELVLEPDSAWCKARNDAGQGCLYIIDEVHLTFGARDWQKIGAGVESYMSQLRKVNDDLLLVTQHAEKVDKNFRRNATEWLYLRNMGKTRLWGGVSLKGRFRWSKFEVQPMRTDKPVQSGWFNLYGQGHEKLYHTMSGVGIAGRLTCEEQKHEGRGMWVWVAACIGLIVCAFALPKALGKGAGMLVHGALGSFMGEQTGTNKAAQKSSMLGVAVRDVPGPAHDVPGPAHDVPGPAAGGVECTGVAQLGVDHKLTFLLSDGQVVKSSTGRVSGYVPDVSVTIDGIKYPWRRREPASYGGYVGSMGPPEVPTIDLHRSQRQILPSLPLSQ